MSIASFFVLIRLIDGRALKCICLRWYLGNRIGGRINVDLWETYLRRDTSIQMIVEYGLQCYGCDGKLLVLYAIRNVDVEGFGDLLCWSYRNSNWSLI
jgi:hypothetical protein